MRRADLILPADLRMIRAVREVACSLATSLPFTLDDIDDLGVAVSEMVAVSLSGCDRGQSFEVHFEVRSSEIVMSGQVSGVGRPAVLEGVAAELVTVMTDSHRVQTTGDTTTFRLKKRIAGYSGTRTLDDNLESSLFARYRETGDPAVRDAIVERHSHLAASFARRYSSRGLAVEDLTQTALLAMMRAVDRFDPAHGASFATFASRTMDGELKRSLRDRAWSVRPPRDLQERFLRIRRAEETLTHDMGRAPTLDELAADVGLDPTEVIEAHSAGLARTSTSLSVPDGGAEHPMAPVLPTPERGFGRVEDELQVAGLLEGLNDMEREIVTLRYFDSMPQDEIAEKVGVSQSYVSRLLRRTLERMGERSGHLEPLGQAADGEDSGDRS